MNNWDHDVVLRTLSELPEPLGSLASAFPGAAGVLDDPPWISEWFLKLARSYLEGNPPADLTLTASSVNASGADLALLARPPVQHEVRFISILPHHFRGFRTLRHPINLNANLLVIEGPNSSGKTSISEAIEWVITGLMSRRSSGQHGHPRELVDCITNEFRPTTGETWVELLLSVDGKEMRLRRTLQQDYGEQHASQPISLLTVDGIQPDPGAERALLEDLFAGLHPILMQHTLRQFIHNDPSSRRQYFEKLLQIDELTELISRAVVGEPLLRDLQSNVGTSAIDSIRDVRECVQDAKIQKALKDLSKSSSDDAQAECQQLLINVAAHLFPELVNGAISFKACKNAVWLAQERAREAELPILRELRKPLRQRPPDMKRLRGLHSDALTAQSALESARQAVKSLDDAKLAAVKAFEVLVNGNLIATGKTEDQHCPICLAPSKSLTSARIDELLGWAPLAQAFNAASDQLAKKESDLRKEVEILKIVARSFKSNPPSSTKLRSLLKGKSSSLRTAVERTCMGARELNNTAEQLEEALDSVTRGQPFPKIPELSTTLSAYSEQIDHLDELASASARGDEAYKLRELWLNAADKVVLLEREFAWQRALEMAQARLKDIRKGLVRLRAELIEDARQTFSQQITHVWSLLRSDSGASFSQLRIPQVRGKGFKLELEVKALIRDAVETREVDALRVFSESQVNVLGIAAYVTRARLLGHRVLIFDDPVQSMDEEHFRTFADQLLDGLLSEGFQVVVLTHSDQFARRISYHHRERPNYVTLSTRMSRRKGCQVDEGNRRIQERLKRAKKLGEDGHLEDAWRFIRLAIERLYTVIKMASDSAFDPDSWRNMSAEYMWNEGVGDFIEEKAQGMGGRLKEILDLTVTGAHDKAARSETDLNNAIEDLESLRTNLRIGD